MDAPPRYVCPVCNGSFASQTLNENTEKHDSSVEDAILDYKYSLNIGNANMGEGVNDGNLTLDVNIPLPCGCNNVIPVRTYVHFAFTITQSWEIDEVIEIYEIIFVDSTAPTTQILNEHRFLIEAQDTAGMQWFINLEELGSINVAPVECVGFYHCTNAPNTTTLLTGLKADDFFYDRGLTLPDAPVGVFFCAGVSPSRNLPTVTVYPRASKAKSQLSNRVTISCSNFNTYKIFYVGSTTKNTFMQHHVVLVNPTDVASIDWLRKKFSEFPGGIQNALFYFGFNGNAWSVPYSRDIKHVLNVFIVGDVDITGGAWDTVTNLMFKRK